MIARPFGPRAAAPTAGLVSCLGLFVLAALAPLPAGAQPADEPRPATSALPADLAPLFSPPEEYAGELGTYRSPLRFDDGTPVRSADDWQRRREEILAAWHRIMGPWPELLKRPRVEYLEQTQREGFTQHRVRIEVADDHFADAYLLIPEGEGPFPGVVVPFYDARTGAGLEKELRDFGYQLTRRGFVSLSLGGVSPRRGEQVSKQEQQIQPLSFMAYAAANCHTILAQHEKVDPGRIGIVGHSYGGKWAMFASCLHDKFAAGVWSDGGIVFDEKRGNVNYWEPWYLGFAADQKRKPGIPDDSNPRTGAYKTLVENGRDLHELHALMAPRPFLVSGGSEDRPQRWIPLNHALAVNRLLGASQRVAMSNREGHNPTAESNEQIYQFFEHFLK